MQRILLIIIIWITSTGYSYPQIHPILTDVELLKGKVKKIETRYYDPDTKRTSKTVSEYDSLGQMIFKINYDIKKNPHKEYFSYDSVGNIIMRIYENNDYSHQYIYEYKYDAKGRIISQSELRDGKFSGGYDSIIYNNDNLLIQYIQKQPYLSTQFFIRHLEGSNNEKIRYIEEKYDSGRISIIEEIRLYNNHGFLTKKKRKAVTQYPDETTNGIIVGLRNLAEGKLPLNGKHSEEYDYVNYKYDKQSNWTEHQIYLNWKEKGSKIHMKIKRKIEYYK